MTSQAPFNLEPYKSRLERFFGEVAIIQHYQRLSANIAKQTILDLQQRDKQLSGLNDETRELLGKSVNLFSFYNPYTGIILPYFHKAVTHQETAQLVHLHKNKQYQWLLVEAYELFEDFVVSLYEFIRAESALFRLGKDAGLPTSELKKKVPQIIDMLRKKLPELARMEVENQTVINLRLHVCMAEKFRHVIVHKNGKTGDASKIVDKILKSANLLGDKAREPNARQIIGNYIGTGDVEGVIALAERSVFRYGSLSMDINRHENLVNALMAHALVTTQSLINHMGKNLLPADSARDLKLASDSLQRRAEAGPAAA